MPSLPSRQQAVSSELLSCKNAIKRARVGEERQGSAESSVSEEICYRLSARRLYCQTRTTVVSEHRYLSSFSLSSSLTTLIFRLFVCRSVCLALSVCFDVCIYIYVHDLKFICYLFYYYRY